MRSNSIIALLNLILQTWSLNIQKRAQTQIGGVTRTRARKRVHCKSEQLLGKLLNGKYMVEKVIGNGRQAVVFSASSQEKNMPLNASF